MGRKGFTLVELMVVMGIIGILLAIATLNFRAHSGKAGIESQMRTLQADVLDARMSAMYEKSPHLLVLAAGQYTIYRTPSTSGPVKVRRTMKHPLSWSGANEITFDSCGIANFESGVVSKTVQVASAGSGTASAVIVSKALVNMGRKLTDGTFQVQ